MTSIKIPKVILILLVSFLVSDLTSKMCMEIVGLNNTAHLFSWWVFLEDGYALCFISACILVTLPMLALYCFFSKGYLRWVSYWVLATWLSIVFMLYFASFILIKIEGLSVTSTVLYILRTLSIAPRDTVIFSHALNILLLSSLGLILAFMGAFLSRKMFKEQKVFGQASFATPFDLRKARLYGKKGILIGKDNGEYVSLPGGESVLVTAPTGSGKTTSIAIPNLLNWSSSVVVNDLKGELFRITARHRKDNLNNEVICFSPSKQFEGAKAYNPFFYVSKNSDYMIRDIQLISEILIPTTKHGDSFWYQSSRELFVALAMYLFEDKGMATLSAINDLSKQPSFVSWAGPIAEETENIMIKQTLFSLLESDEKTRKNIIKDFQSRMSLFSDPIVRQATSTNEFDLKNLRKEKMSIYINIPPFDTERLSPLITLFWAQLIQQMTLTEPQPDEPETILALLDEFAHMSRINKLKDGLSFLRSYNMRFVILIQYLTQLKSVYGQDDSRGFLNTKVKVAFALNDFEDARFFSLALGNKTVKVKTTSFNSGHGSHGPSRAANHSFKSQPLMTPDELMCLKPNRSIALIEGARPMYFKKAPYFKDVFFNQVADKD